MTTEEYNNEAETLRHELKALAYGYLDNADDADDTVQDVLLKLWDMHAELHSPMAPLARVITRNLCVDIIRRRPLRQQTDIDELQEQPADTTTSTLEDRMMAAIGSLPSDAQVVLRLKHIDGMSTAAIARLTGRSETAIRQSLSRARRAVLKLMQGDGTDTPQ